jgi:hypothetical protein
MEKQSAPPACACSMPSPTDRTRRGRLPVRINAQFSVTADAFGDRRVAEDSRSSGELGRNLGSSLRAGARVSRAWTKVLFRLWRLCALATATSRHKRDYPRFRLPGGASRTDVRSVGVGHRHSVAGQTLRRAWKTAATAFGGCSQSHTSIIGLDREKGRNWGRGYPDQLRTGETNLMRGDMINDMAGCSSGPG